MRNAWLLVLLGCSSPAPDKAPPPPYAPAAARAVMKVHRSAPTREPIAPWSLTASDGSGLELEAIDAKAVIEGPLAFTELHLRFRNPEDRVREGTFAITLPARAAVSRFAMVEDGHLKEAEVVAKALARRAYDDALHRGIDPAILEKGAGNQFTARVFPIPASSTKELVISYSQELTGVGYVLPLTGFPKIDEVAVTLDMDGRPRQELHEKKWQPDHDFFADVETTTGIASGGLIAAAFELQPNDATAADRPTALSLLVDTSASRAPGFARYIARVRTLVNALAVQYPGLTVDVIAFDQEARAMYAGPAQDFGDAQVAAIVERRADGASDLGQALASVHKTTRLAVITDGVVTAGLEAAPLAAAFRKLDLARVDVILAGGIRDDLAAKTLTRVGAHAGDVFDLDDELAPIASGLGEVVRVDVPVEVAGASWFSPHIIPSVRAGTQVMVYAQVAAPQSQLVATLGGAQRAVAVRQGTPAFVERATARVAIDELETQLAATTVEATKATLRKQIETKSIASRVVSSQATMLVLDNDEEYKRYGIDRTALVDILVVGPHGLEQQHRTFIASKEHPRAPHGKPTREEALAMAQSAGTLGAIGTGRYYTIGHGSGSGSGYGVGGGRGGLRGHISSVPTVSIAAPMVQGSLDKSFIRRYIKRNLEKITYCYERELLSHPRLHGTIQTHFVIGPTGAVVEATATGFDDTVASCVAGVVRDIEFPAVRGESVVVNYPFTFRTAETPEEPAPETGLSLPSAPATTAATQAIAPAPVAQAPAPIAHTEPELATDPPAAQPPSDYVAPPRTPAPSPVPTPPVRHMSPIATPYESEQARQAERTQPISDMPRFNPATSALRGKLVDVMRSIAKHDPPGALALAHAWRDEQPTDVLAIVGLGEAYEAAGDPTAAARAYGSLIDLYPSRADYRRFAGERLERLGPVARALEIDTYRRAVADRPDHITGHRLLAYALLRNDDYAGAFDAILKGVDQHTPEDRFAGADRVFARDAGMIATAYLAHGGDRDRVTKALAKRHLEPFARRSTRVMLYWETDANDVDLHVRDAHGGHAWYSHKELESGGELYADITTGYGPECFEMLGTPSAGPYELGVHYYRQGPMGYGMGLLQIVRFDGQAFSFEDRPYVIMQDEAYVSLGKLR